MSLEAAMGDLVLLGLVAALFLLAWAFVHGCGALIEPAKHVHQQEEEIEP